MAGYPREELERMVQSWLDTNRHCEQIGDWRPLADLFTEDATYGWNLGPRGEFMAVGRDQIRDVALGLEMGGLDGWTYPYQEILIDERKGQVIGLWKQIADAKRADGADVRGSGDRRQLVPLRAATSNGRGSATSSTSGTRRTCSWR